MAGALTRQRLMPPAKQTTISCSVCSRLSETRQATNSAIGRVMTAVDGRLSATTFRNTTALWRWSTIRFSVVSIWLSTARVVSAATAASVGQASWRSR